MKIIYLPVIATFLVTFIIIYLTPIEAAASHNTCWIEAGSQDVFVRVFDKDRSGNIIAHRNSRGYFSVGHEIWKGKLEKGQKTLINSTYGEIRYDYKRSSDDRAYGNNTASCDRGGTIILP